MAVTAIKDKPKSGNLIAAMAERFALEPEEFKRVVKSTCGLGKANDEQFLAFLAVAHEHDLNPLTREIYAFTKPDGGIQTIVAVDGWYKKMNQNPMFDGIEFSDIIEGGQLVAITARIYRKDRQHASEVTEYMKECRRNTDPWRQWPARMLRHKAAIQAIRVAFNLAGIMDPDEAERFLEGIKNARSQTVPPALAGSLDQVADAIPANEPASPPPDDKAQVVETTATKVDEVLTKPERKELTGMATALGIDLEPAEAVELFDRLAKSAGADSFSTLKQSQRDGFIAALQQEASNG